MPLVNFIFQKTRPFYLMETHYFTAISKPKNKKFGHVFFLCVYSLNFRSIDYFLYIFHSNINMFPPKNKSFSKYQNFHKHNLIDVKYKFGEFSLLGDKKIGMFRFKSLSSKKIA